MRNSARSIRDHLRLDRTDPRTWQGADFDFTGATFDGGDFSDACFSGGTISFAGARFIRVRTDSSEDVARRHIVSFDRAKFEAGTVTFEEANVAGVISFIGTTFTGTQVDFRGSSFRNATVLFGGARIYAGAIGFADAEFSSGTGIYFGGEFDPESFE